MIRSGSVVSYSESSDGSVALGIIVSHDGNKGHVFWADVGFVSQNNQPLEEFQEWVMGDDNESQYRLVCE